MYFDNLVNSSGFSIGDDFISGTRVGSLGWSSYITGDASVKQLIDGPTIIPQNPGQLVLNTGTGTNKVFVSLTNQYECTPGLILPDIYGNYYFETLIYIPELPLTLEDEFEINIGSVKLEEFNFEISNGVYFCATSKNKTWLLRSVINSNIVQEIETNILVKKEQWQKLIINSDKISKFYISDSPGNIEPNKVGEINELTSTSIAPTILINKINGFQSVNLYTDYISINYRLNNYR